MADKLDKKEVINIATGDVSLVAALVERVNKVYKTDFKLIGSEDRGGVEFAIVERGSSTLDEIFLLGFFYGDKVEILRSKA